MKRVIQQIVIAAKSTPREFFAPIIGAYKGIKREYKAISNIETRKHHTTRFSK